MGIAEDMNVGFTVAAMNPQRGEKLQARFQEMLRQAPRVSDVRTGRTSMAAPQFDALRLLALEYQQGMHRAFRRADGALIHSHECQVEVVRRCERDGYCFSLA